MDKLQPSALVEAGNVYRCLMMSSKYGAVKRMLTKQERQNADGTWTVFILLPSDNLGYGQMGVGRILKSSGGTKEEAYKNFNDEHKAWKTIYNF